jgi:hypothetical protein
VSWLSLGMEVHRTTAPAHKSHRAIRPECSVCGGIIGAICLFGGKNLPSALLKKKCTRHRPDCANASGLGSPTPRNRFLSMSFFLEDNPVSHNSTRKRRLLLWIVRTFEYLMMCP